MNPASRIVRKTWQRAATRLPFRHAPFAVHFPETVDFGTGAHHAPLGFSGLLLAELGNSYIIRPTVFADGKPGALANEDRTYATTEPTRRLFAMSDAGIIGAHGICYSPSTRTAISETLESWDLSIDRHPVFSTPRLPAARALPGVSLSLATLGGETFYHFLIESLPKLALARAFLPHIDQLLVPRYIENAKTAWLRQLGFTQKIVWLDDLAHWRCEQLLFTNRLARHYEPNAWCVHTLRDFAATPAHNPSTGSALWLDRSGVANRATTWEREFAAQLPELESVDLGAIDPAQVLTRCSSARIFAGLHGAAFANMVFSPPGAKIIELMQRAFHPFYARLAQACGHEHLVVRIPDADVGRTDTLAIVRKFIPL